MGGHKHMGGEFQFIDIILFALVAAFLILRLRSVLGRRDGHQGSSTDPFKTSRRGKSGDDKIVRLPDREGRPAESDEPPAAGPDESLSPLEAGLANIRVADPKFDADEFISGARTAFEMILSSFAKGDMPALRPLLSPEVLNNFTQSVRDREQAGETMDLTLVGIKSAEIVEAYMAGRTAHLTVKFVSEQTSVVRDESNEIIEGDPETVTEVTDYWTFARDTRNPDPNWILVATGAQE